MTIAGYVGESAGGLEPGDEGEGVHLVTLDGRCMAGIATEVYHGGRITVEAFPVPGMVVPNVSFVWSYEPADGHRWATSSYHRRAECPRRQRRT